VLTSSKPPALLPRQRGSASVGNPSFPRPLRGLVGSKGPVSSAKVSLLEMQMEVLFFLLSASLSAEQGWCLAVGQAGVRCM